MRRVFQLEPERHRHRLQRHEPLRGRAACCLTGEPGGLCVTDCSTSGERDTCPSDGYCDRDTFSVNGVDTKLTLCLQSCTKDEECRAEYRCSGASAGTGKVCRRR